MITDTFSEPGFADWEATLKREGVPYDCVITSPVPASNPAGCTSTLPSLSSTASDGTQVANYEGVIVADSGTSVAVKPKAPTPILPLGGTTTPQKNADSKPIAYGAVQVRPKTVWISKKGKITVSPACKATNGKTAKDKLCAGSFTLKIAGHKPGHRFRFRSPKTHRFTVTLSTKVLASATRTRRHHRRRMVGSLLISTTQTHAKARTMRGTLTIQGLTSRPGLRHAHGRAPAGSGPSFLPSFIP